MIRYLQLPFQFDASGLQAEVTSLDQAWRLHFNRQQYDGAWSGLALRSPGGETDNLLAEAHVEGRAFENTPLLGACPGLQAVLQTFRCPVLGARLLKLERGAVVREHTDAGLAFESGEVRLHIPIVTDPLVEFYLDGDRLQMEAGTCWYINAALPHRLANPSPVDRVHLVVDCEVNDWLQALFQRPDLPVRSEKDTSGADELRRQQVIAALRQSGDPERMRMADDLQRTGSYNPF